VLLRSTALVLLLSVAIGPATPAGRPSKASAAPQLLYTAASNYEPLAWMHGDDRFSPDAAMLLKSESGTHPFLPDFAESADADISFDGERVLFAGKRHAQDPWQIWEVNKDGSDPRRIISRTEDCVRPLYLPDDRVVYAAKVDGRFVIEVADLSGGESRALTYGPANVMPTAVLRDGRILFAAGYPLGSNVDPEIYTVYADGSGVESYRCDHGRSRYSATQSSSGDLVFASSRGLSRFTSAHAQELPLPSPPGEYADLIEDHDSSVLFAWRPTARARFQLKRWSPGSRELVSMVSDRSASLAQPKLIGPRQVPKRHPSGLHDWSNANLLCLNAYTSKYQFGPGSVHSVRLYTRAGDGTARLLGTAPVEKDGSFFVQVPGDQPLQIELLDSTGKTLKRESGFFWMRRGEQRACVGCHAGPETAPENAVPMTLLKSTTPAAMTGQSPQTAAGGTQ
jgi:Hydrazine synthase alpha subunit middle domain